MREERPTIEELAEEVRALRFEIELLKREKPRGALLSVNEAAPLLGVKPETLRKWVQAGRITHTRVGGRPKFSMQTIEAFRARRTEPARARLRISRRSA